MASSKEYLALKNYLHNNLGFSKEDLRQMMKEIIRDAAIQAIKDYFETNDFLERVRRGFHRTNHYYSGRNDEFTQCIEKVGKKIIEAELGKRLKISLVEENKG